MLGGFLGVVFVGIAEDFGVPSHLKLVFLRPWTGCWNLQGLPVDGAF